MAVYPALAEGLKILEDDVVKALNGDGSRDEPYVVVYYQVGVCDLWGSEPIEYFPQRYETLGDAVERMESTDAPDEDGKVLAVIGFQEDETAVIVTDENGVTAIL